MPRWERDRTAGSPVAAACTFSSRTAAFARSHLPRSRGRLLRCRFVVVISTGSSYLTIIFARSVPTGRGDEDSAYEHDYDYEVGGIAAESVGLIRCRFSPRGDRCC